MKSPKLTCPEIGHSKDKKEFLQDEQILPDAGLNFREAHEAGREYTSALDYLHDWLLIDRKEISKKIFDGIFSSPSRVSGVSSEDLPQFTYLVSRAGDDVIANVAQIAAQNPDNPDFADMNFDELLQQNRESFEDIKVCVIDCGIEIQRPDGSVETPSFAPYMYFEYDENKPDQYRIVPWYKDLAESSDTISSIRYIPKKITSH